MPPLGAPATPIGISQPACHLEDGRGAGIALVPAPWRAELLAVDRYRISPRDIPRPIDHEIRPHVRQRLAQIARMNRRESDLLGSLLGSVGHDIHPTNDLYLRACLKVLSPGSSHRTRADNQGSIHTGPHMKNASRIAS